MIKSINEGIRIIDQLQVKVDDLNNQIKQVHEMILELRLEPDPVAKNNEDNSSPSDENPCSECKNDCFLCDFGKVASERLNSFCYVFEGGIQKE